MKKIFLLALTLSACTTFQYSRLPSESSDGLCGVIQNVDKDFTQVTVLLDPQDPNSKKDFWPSEKMAKQAKAILGKPDYLFCQNRDGSKLSWSLQLTGRLKELARANSPQRIFSCGNGFDFIFGGVLFTEAKNEYSAYIHGTQARVTREEYADFIAFRGEQNTPFELVISKSQSAENLHFSKNFGELPEKIEEQARTNKDRINGNALVQYEDSETKKLKFGMIACVSAFKN